MATGLIVSAHCDVCPHCQGLLAEFNQSFAHQAFSATQSFAGMEDMLSAITALEPEVKTQVQAAPIELELDGRRFALPRALEPLARNVSSWSHLVGKLWQANVEIEDGVQGHFIYMAKGGKVPEHTHKGTELTLVIDGEFEDDKGVYRNGDFVALDSAHTHAPMSNVDEGCLVFSIVDQPLHFTSGLARLLNPFSHLFFK